MLIGGAAVLVLAGVVFGASLSKCGVGLGLGEGTPHEGRASDPPPPTRTDEREDETGLGRVVVVAGSRCRIGNDLTPRECADVCIDLSQAKAVSIDATEGAHETVEALASCLRASGVAVTLLSR